MDFFKVNKINSYNRTNNILNISKNNFRRWIIKLNSYNKKLGIIKIRVRCRLWSKKFSNLNNSQQNYIKLLVKKMQESGKCSYS